MSTLESATEQLASALLLLDRQLRSGPKQLVNLLGWELPPGASDIGLAGLDLSAVLDKLNAVTQIRVTGTSVEVSAAYAELGVAVADVLGQLRRVASGFTATPDYLAKTNIVNEFFPRLLDLVVMQGVAQFAPPAFAVGQLAGIFIGETHVADPAKFQTEHVRHIVRWDRLGTLLSNPAQLFRDVYGWGTPDFNANALVGNVGNILQFAGVSNQVRELPRRVEHQLAGQAPAADVDPSIQLFVSLVKGLGLDTVDVGVSMYGLGPSSKGGSDGGIGISPYLRGSTDLRFPLADKVALTFEASADTERGVAMVFRPGRGPELKADLNTLSPIGGSANMFLAVRYETDEGKPLVLLDVPKALRMEIKSLFAGGGFRSGRPAITVGLEGGHLVIDASGGDGFLSTVLGGARIESSFDLNASFSPGAGLQLGGSGGLEVQIPVHVLIGPVEVQKLYLGVRFEDGGKLPIEVSAGFSASLGPIQASVERMGVMIDLAFPAGGGNFGPAELGFGFKPPNGIGLAVDVGVISGGGYLYADPDRGEYAGALELEFANFLELKAVGLISTRMPDGSNGFSLLIIIATEFGGGGIQLGYGFTLLAVGGLIGLNRAMNLEALAQGVRSGSIESVMFPKDVVANAPRIISDLRTFFPAERGKFLIGPMAKIGWGTPALVTVSLGVIIEIPGNIAIVGVLRCILPTKELPLLVLQVNFVGAIEFDKSRMWFYAELFDSRILFMTIEGGMGLLVGWGDDADLVLTVGGFHPSYQPPPMPFPVPRRLAVDILNQPGRRIRVEGYFAITSNTVQFGAHAELVLGFDDFGIHGHLGFDALFQFSPFAFKIQIAAGVSLRAFGVGLFGIDLNFALEGPAPWRAHGRGSISLLFFEISADFDITWGEERNTVLPPVDVLPLLAGEFAKVEGWETRLPTGGTKALVTLRPLTETDDLVLHPLGTLFVRQRAIPLNVRVDRVGQQSPRDGKRFTAGPARDSELVVRSVTSDKFAMAQFQNMDDAAKLSRPAYESQDAGLELTAAQGAIASARAVRRSTRYEQWIIDSKRPVDTQALAAETVVVDVKPGPRSRFHDVDPAVFSQLLQGSSTSRSPLSQREAKLRQPFDETVQVPGQRFVVAHVQNNRQAFGPTPGSFRSLAAAYDALAEWVDADPRLAGTLHVIPESEATGGLAEPHGWSAAGVLPSAAAWTEAVLLNSGKVLLAGGGDAAALFDPVTVTWGPTGSLTSQRRLHSMTKLTNGRVLAAGGNSAETYDPITGVWTALAKGLNTPRHSHSATLLPDGKVLVAGGIGGSSALVSAELFDPASGEWTETGSMSDARAGHVAVLVDGKVLVVGGTLPTGPNQVAGSSYCEIYDPETGTWTPTGSMGVPRRGHHATSLRDGSVLVTGGDDPRSRASAERFRDGTWTAVADMPWGRNHHRSVLLRSGQVLVIGGTGSPAYDVGYKNATLYDLASDTWRAVGGMAAGRWAFAATQLADGRVLVAGGNDIAGAAAPGENVLNTTAEIFTP